MFKIDIVRTFFYRTGCPAILPYMIQNTLQDRLTAAIAVVDELPEDTKAAFVEEFSERIASAATSLLTPAQRAEVARRLDLPERSVPSSHIDTIFSRYRRA